MLPGDPARWPIRAMLTEALDLVLPRTCARCHGFELSHECERSAPRALCAACWQEWQWVRLLPDERHRELGALSVYCWGNYEQASAEVITAFKDAGRWDLAPVLAQAMARALTAGSQDRVSAAPGWTPRQPLILIPIPSRARAVRRRGQDHLRLLGAEVARMVPWVRVVPALRVIRGSDQVGLGARARARNRRGSMRLTRAGQRLEGAHVVLLDDVLTSGATMVEAFRVISATNPAAVWGVTALNRESSRSRGL